MSDEPNVEYVLNLSTQQDVIPDPPKFGIVIDFSPSEDGKPAELSVRANMSVADIERGCAAALEALDLWWKREAPQFSDQTELGERDPSFTNRVWTPFSSEDGDDEPFDDWGSSEPDKSYLQFGG